ncbi:MAG: hypothetical protein CO108_10680, partial [Deltaproteobacteria bacterium CG_4_9_14_3_um_filter_63_12]
MLFLVGGLAGCGALDFDPYEDVYPETNTPGFQSCLIEAACVLGDPSQLVLTRSASSGGIELCELSTQPCPTGTVCAYPATNDETCTPNQ